MTKTRTLTDLVGVAFIFGVPAERDRLLRLVRQVLKRRQDVLLGEGQALPGLDHDFRQVHLFVLH